MARTAITPTVLAVSAAATGDPAGTATTAGAGNGVSIAGSIAAPELTILRVSNASGGSGTVTVKAGTQPSAIASGQGDLVSTIATGAASWLGPFESARFGQPDGSLFVDSSVVMTVTAFKVNRH
jgi:hypothetical protein